MYVLCILADGIYRGGGGGLLDWDCCVYTVYALQSFGWVRRSTVWWRHTAGCEIDQFVIGSSKAGASSMKKNRLEATAMDDRCLNARKYIIVFFVHYDRKIKK